MNFRSDYDTLLYNYAKWLWKPKSCSSNKKDKIILDWNTVQNLVPCWSRIDVHKVCKMTYWRSKLAHWQVDFTLLSCPAIGHFYCPYQPTRSTFYHRFDNIHNITHGLTVVYWTECMVYKLLFWWSFLHLMEYAFWPIVLDQFNFTFCIWCLTLW